MTTFFWVLYSYCLIERLGELVLSSRNKKRMERNGFAERESDRGLQLMIALHTAWFVGTLVEAVFAPRAISPLLYACAAVSFLAAQVLRFWTLRTLGAYWNISVLTTDSPQPRFVSQGPYRFIRHPNYMVVIVEIATLPLIGGAVVVSLVFSALNSLILWRRIRLEESHLFAIPGYRENFEGIGRFIPRRIPKRSRSR